MDWDSFAASLDAGATLADFFPVLSNGASHSAAGDGARIAAGDDASTAADTNRLRERLVGGTKGRSTSLFYSRVDCCDYGLPAGELARLALAHFKDRQPQLLPPRAFACTRNNRQQQIVTATATATATPTSTPTTNNKPEASKILKCEKYGDSVRRNLKIESLKA